MTTPFVAVAGASGALGQLITLSLLTNDHAVKALVRPNTPPSRTAALLAAGATILPIDLLDSTLLTTELTGAICIVSALQGLKPVLHTAQGSLLSAAIAAKVPRFIPSDFSLDFTKTAVGSNRNNYIRREFHSQLEKSGIAWTSIHCGGFLDIIGDRMINHQGRSVVYIGDPNQKVDFTTMQDVANYTAAVAVDPKETPRNLRIASVEISAQELADLQTKITGQPYKVKWIGTLGSTKFMIGLLKWFGGHDDMLPAWQGMQYMENMMSGDGKLEPLDNDRYALKWTDVDEYLRQQTTAK